MFNKKTGELLNSYLQEIPLMVAEKSLRHDIDDLVKLVFPSSRIAIIDDVNTAQALGNKIFSALKNKFRAEHITLNDGVEATYNIAEYIIANTKKSDFLVAVGSGTISDLCKYLSSKDNKSYITFPTAASMNGYLSANASITIDGHKTSIPCKLPEAVFCDLSVITSAPLRFTKSGFGDSLARPTAQADWLLSHLLLGTKYDERSFTLTYEIEQELFTDAKGIAKNDYKSIKTLMELLLLSGLGMTIAGGSYPASQGEHMIAHTYNMLKDSGLKNSGKKIRLLHGEEIGVTSLYMANRQINLLETLPRISTQEFDKNYIVKLFGAKLAEEFAGEFSKKQQTIRIANCEISKKIWENVGEKLEPIASDLRQIENILKLSEVHSTLESIGWDDNDFNTTSTTARFTRDRFTFLDLE